MSRSESSRLVGSFFFVLAVVSAVSSVSAENVSFRRVHLRYGISVEIPSQWKISSQETQEHRADATREVIGEAGIRGGRANTESLLASRAQPAPAGAAVRLNVSAPAEFTEERLALAREADLLSLRAELVEMFRRLEAAGGPKLLELRTPRVERVNGRHALVVPYTRAGTAGASVWEVTQYKIPVSGRLLELTLSHRQADGVRWKPILEHVCGSLRF